MTDLDRTNAAIVNAFQGGFPVTERPFEPAATAMREGGVEVTAVELAERIAGLVEAGTLSRFGAPVDAGAIGGTTVLVAMRVPEERFEAVAEAVNARPEVAHNYERDHRLNMWFVLSVADPDRVGAVLASIEDETGLETYALPKRREFYLEATFPVDGPLAGGLDLSDRAPDIEPSGRTTLRPRERDLLLEIQDGFPLTRTPYADVAAAIGASPGWVVRTVARFLAEGKLRRVGVVPNHYAIGYTENAMTVWDVPDDAIGAVGEAVGELPFVTHCYERPRHEDVWRYNLFAMVHGRTADEADERVDAVRRTIAEHAEPADEDVLYSTRILKKAGLRLAERAARNTEPAG